MTTEEKLRFLKDLAFPVAVKASPTEEHIAIGLTKRELFAAMAMQGMLASLADKAYSTKHLAHDAVVHADELLTALDKTP